MFFLKITNINTDTQIVCLVYLRTDTHTDTHIHTHTHTQTHTQTHTYTHT